nr:uncharacterized protein LOC107448896 isoform X2 [Parasteatoda tepidariorum]
MYDDEQIVMIPTERSRDHTTITMERLKVSDMDQRNIIHVAGGSHKGIVIYKQIVSGKSTLKPPELSLGFKVKMRSESNNQHELEYWKLKFWFKDVGDEEKIESAEAFLTELISSEERPKDYTGFIKKTMKLMQLKYPCIQKVEVEMKKHSESHQPVPNAFEAKSSKLTADEGKLLEIIEAVYPNSLSVISVAKSSTLSVEDVQKHLKTLEMRGQVKCLSNGNYIRTTKNDSGESNVYTLGTVGPHRVVSTKLPATGMARGAMIAAGSTITRLLGSFPRVDYVFLVGVGGGVPHCYDYTKHVRLGDVVVSTPPDHTHSYVYLYCESANNPHEAAAASIKTWCPPSLKLQKIACDLWRKGVLDSDDRPWESFIEQGLQQLTDQESSFRRPSPETDKLYFMSSEDGEIVDFGHPQPQEGTFDPRKPGAPVLHFGAVGSGRVLMHDDTKRLTFADKHGIMSFDTGFGSVVESIFGNRKDDYIFIRGIADYKDGTKKKEWQPYAALAAAAVMKSILSNLDCD